MKDEKISVLLPAYNHQEYIKDAIYSVLKQTYSNFELLIADDASTDNTWKVIKTIKDKRIKAWKITHNAGTAACLNYLLEKSTGKYICFIGSNDKWRSNKLERQINFFKVNNTYDACYSNIDIIGKKKYKEYEQKNYIDKYSIDNLQDSNDIIHDIFIEQSNVLSWQTAMIKKSVMKKLGCFNLSYWHSFDLDYLIRIALNYKVFIMGDKLVQCRWHKDKCIHASNFKVNDIPRIKNETIYILYKLIKDLRASKYIKIFSNEIKRKINNETDLKCEKFLLFNNYMNKNIPGNILALIYFGQNMHNKEFIETLEKKYNFNSNKLYKFTNTAITTYPESLGDEAKELNKVINRQNKIIFEYGNSRSWKITSPLRSINSLFNKTSK